ncbi:MAG: Phospholipase/carboxylesterase, partial [uncultured Thermomicrobiales bacterium]
VPDNARRSPRRRTRPHDRRSPGPGGGGRADGPRPGRHRRGHPGAGGGAAGRGRRLPGAAGRRSDLVPLPLPRTHRPQRALPVVGPRAARAIGRPDRGGRNPGRADRSARLLPGSVPGARVRRPQPAPVRRRLRPERRTDRAARHRLGGDRFARRDAGVPRLLRCRSPHSGGAGARVRRPPGKAGRARRFAHLPRDGPYRQSRRDRGCPPACRGLLRL